MASKKLEERVKTLQKQPENKVCFDCLKTGLQPAVCLPFGIFICTPCSGIHRQFNGHHVHTISMTTWSEKQVQALEQNGNVKAKAYWLANSHDNGPRDDIARFIRNCFEQKMWVIHDKATASASTPAAQAAPARPTRVAAPAPVAAPAVPSVPNRRQTVSKPAEANLFPDFLSETVTPTATAAKPSPHVPIRPRTSISAPGGSPTTASPHAVVGPSATYASLTFPGAVPVTALSSSAQESMKEISKVMALMIMKHQLSAHEFYQASMTAAHLTTTAWAARESKTGGTPVAAASSPAMSQPTAPLDFTSPSVATVTDAVSTFSFDNFTSEAPTAAATDAFSTGTTTAGNDVFDSGNDAFGAGNDVFATDDNPFATEAPANGNVFGNNAFATNFDTGAVDNNFSADFGNNNAFGDAGAGFGSNAFGATDNPFANDAFGNNTFASASVAAPAAATVSNGDDWAAFGNDDGFSSAANNVNPPATKTSASAATVEDDGDIFGDLVGTSGNTTSITLDNGFGAMPVQAASSGNQTGMGMGMGMGQQGMGMPVKASPRMGATPAPGVGMSNMGMGMGMPQQGMGNMGGMGMGNPGMGYQGYPQQGMGMPNAGMNQGMAQQGMGMGMRPGMGMPPQMMMPNNGMAMMGGNNMMMMNPNMNPNMMGNANAGMGNPNMMGNHNMMYMQQQQMLQQQQQMQQQQQQAQDNAFSDLDIAF